MAGKEKSLKLNMILNVIKNLMGIIFPLISFPYISKILGVDNLGKYNFASSIMSYFILIAGLGINTYAIREGVKFRDNKAEFKRFADEIFSINLISTILAYVLLVIFMLIIPKFQEYTILLIVLSFQIVFKLIGVEWIYSIYEDYIYITVRSIVFQVLSIVMMFLFVRNSEDVLIYTIIIVFSSVGSNILNYFNVRHYCKVSVTKNIDWNKHLKPIIILFAMAVTTTIYVSSDTTILGFICGDYNVGLYSVSAKIYSIMKSVLSSVIVVSIPRLSKILSDNEYKKFNIVSAEIYKILLTVVVPAIVGIIMLRKEIILLISDESYLEATTSLFLLSIAILFCMGAYFWGQCILVPLRKENIVFKVTVISALVNIVLNFILIPKFQENAAAFTTIIAEGIAFFMCRNEGKKHIKVESINKFILKLVIGSLGIVFCVVILSPLKQYLIIYIMLSVSMSVFVYFSIQILLKNEVVTDIKDNFIKRTKKF